MTDIIYCRTTPLFRCFVAGLLQNKKKLITYVIASGVMYGEGESVMRYLFNVRCCLLLTLAVISYLPQVALMI